MSQDNLLKEIWFIRHGQSMGNAGYATSNPDTISLTDIGHQQAKLLSTYITLEPELIITSPYARTFQTATPTLHRFHQSKHSEWPIHEFTYLAPVRCIDTTADDRKDMVYDYWLRSEPDYIDGVGAESFSQFIKRIKTMWQDLHQSSVCGNILVFTHGLFLNALRWSLVNSFAPPHSAQYDFIP